MKKIINILIIVILLMGLVSCVDNGDIEDTTTDRKIPTSFTSMSNEYPDLKDSNVDLYFYANDNLPYIDIETFIMMLDGLYYSNEIEYVKDYENDTIVAKYEIEYENTNDVDVYEAVLDFKLDTIYVETLDFFSGYVQSTATEYGKGLSYLDPIYNIGTAITYKLSDYNFDMKVEGELFLVPLHILNLLFNQEVYFDVYYNGEKLYGIDTSDLEDKDIKKILKSNKNKETMPESLKNATHDFLAFALDYFYGLKNDRNIESGYTFLNDYESGLKGKNTSKTIYEIIMGLDDLHTSHITRGYYDNSNLKTSYDDGVMGVRTETFYNDLDEVVYAAADYFGYNRFTGEIYFKDYELIDNDKTAIIYLMEFTVDTPDEVEAIIKDLPATVENVVFDLVANTGGNLGAVLRIFTMMTDKDIWYHAQNPLDGATISYGVKGDETVTVYNQYNYFIKSSKITFSAANLMVSIAQELGIPTMGKKSAGGASSIGFFVLPEGSIVIMSSNMVLSRVENEVYTSIENGLYPDHILNWYYNKNEILEAIEGILA